MNIKDIRDNIGSLVRGDEVVPVEMHNRPWGTIIPIGLWNGEPPEESLSTSQFQGMITRVTVPTSLTGLQREVLAVYNPLQKNPLDGYDVDPYSWALADIRLALVSAHKFSGSMSEGEYLILCEIVKVIAEEDPAWLTSDLEAMLRASKLMQAVI